MPKYNDGIFNDGQSLKDVRENIIKEMMVDLDSTVTTEIPALKEKSQELSTAFEEVRDSVSDKISDAPSDGKRYVRLNDTWVEDTSENHMELKVAINDDDMGLVKGFLVKAKAATIVEAEHNILKERVLQVNVPTEIMDLPWAHFDTDTELTNNYPPASHPYSIASAGNAMYMSDGTQWVTTNTTTSYKNLVEMITRMPPELPDCKDRDWSQPAGKTEFCYISVNTETPEDRNGWVMVFHNTDGNEKQVFFSKGHVDTFMRDWNKGTGRFDPWVKVIGENNLPTYIATLEKRIKDLEDKA